MKGMEKIKLVIEIDDNLFNRIKYLEPKASTMLDKLMRAVQNGIPLPKGHGDLIDKSEVEKLDDKLCNTECGTCPLNGCFYDKARTIIEADKAEK